jgi:hypothetical protein
MKTLPALAAVCGIILGTTIYFASHTHPHPQKPVPIRAVVVELNGKPVAAIIVATDGTETTVPFMDCFNDAPCKQALLDIEKAGNENSLRIVSHDNDGTSV